MQVQRPERQAEQGRRDDLAVVGEDQQAGVEGEHGIDRVGVAQPGRRQDGPDAGLLDGRWFEPELAAGGSRGGGDHPHQVNRRVLGEAPEGRYGERAAAEEDRPDAIDAGRPAAHASALVASRIPASSSSSSP